MELESILREIKRLGYYGYRLNTDSHKVWVIDDYNKPASLRCDSVLEAWQSFLSIHLSTPDVVAQRDREEALRRARIQKLLRPI